MANLKEIAEDSSASEAEQERVTILLDFHHKSGPKAQERLVDFAQQ